MGRFSTNDALPIPWPAGNQEFTALVTCHYSRPVEFAKYEFGKEYIYPVVNETLIDAVCAAYSQLQSSRIQARGKPFHDWFRTQLRGLIDQQLLRLSADPNNDSLRILIDTNRDRVVRFLCREYPRAEFSDLDQAYVNSWVELARRPGHYDPHRFASLANYLKLIAQRQLIDGYRKESKRVDNVPFVHGRHQHCPLPPSNQLLGNAVRNAVSKLRSKHREIMTILLDEDRLLLIDKGLEVDYARIEVHFDNQISHQAIRRRCQRALKEIKPLLADVLTLLTAIRAGVEKLIPARRKIMTILLDEDRLLLNGNAFKVDYDGLEVHFPDQSHEELRKNVEQTLDDMRILLEDDFSTHGDPPPEDPTQ